ncbi:hypothetical protein SPBRAN_2008 [uncultured Candidatus Thioglobus sp.]|nr:hypothetical protein SPBRAN_2008 [uncultured Candidatus Thioglobus sp.]
MLFLAYQSAAGYLGVRLKRKNMENTITAIIISIGVLAALSYSFKMGNLTFWKLAAKLPDEAINWVSNDPAWVIITQDQQKPTDEFDGPFYLAVPSLGKTIKLYAHYEKLEESQKRFINKYKDFIPQRPFPYLSALFLLYPIAAMLSLYEYPASISQIIGYGFANLGYLLGAAFIYPGHFYFLSFEYRIQTLIGGIFFFLIGIGLSNITA